MTHTPAVTLTDDQAVRFTFEVAVPRTRFTLCLMGLDPEMTAKSYVVTIDDTDLEHQKRSWSWSPGLGRRYSYVPQSASPLHELSTIRFSEPVKTLSVTVADFSRAPKTRIADRSFVMGLRSANSSRPHDLITYRADATASPDDPD